MCAQAVKKTFMRMEKKKTPVAFDYTAPPPPR